MMEYQKVEDDDVHAWKLVPRVGLRDVLILA
jgi:hypothetical protein